MGEKRSLASSNRPSDLHIRLFGCLELYRGNRLLPSLATHKTQSLFAYLVLHRELAQPRDKLAALFWGDQSDLRARRSLATALWRIRRILPTECLASDTASVQLDATRSFWLDVAEFDRHFSAANRETEADRRADHWREAVTLYSGDLLEGFYDDWCIEERYRLETMYLDALRHLVNHCQAQGHLSSVPLYAAKYLARDPLEASLHLAVMRAWIALGNGTKARQQWQQCCAIWQQELHSSPSPDLVEEAARILGTQFAVATPVRPVAEPPRRSTFLESPPFVGRTMELETLLARWEQVAQGTGSVMLIGGEAGIGKTRLIEEFAARVRYHGGLVARGRCWEPERDLAYQPVVEILQELKVGSLPAIPEWARKELARLIPDFETRVDRGSEMPRSDLRLGQSALLNALVAALRQAALQAPLLMILEDVHAASASTLAAFSFLARHTRPARVLMLASYRTEEVNAGDEFSSLTEQLGRDGLAERLSLKRLSADAVAELVQRLRGGGDDSALTARLFKHTQGNPLFLIETLRALEPGIRSGADLPVPDGVIQLIHCRLSRTSAQGRQLLACAAVAGPAFDFDIVCFAAGLDEEPALEAMDELLRQGFVREGSGIGGQDYEFEHPVVHQVVYLSLHHRRRRRLHRLMGEALEHLNRGQPALLAGRMAYHFDRAEIADKALDYADKAVDYSWDLGTPGEVVRYCEMALRWLDQSGVERFGKSHMREKCFDLRLEQEEALDILGRREDQAAVLEIMMQLAEQLNDPSRRALVRIRRFWFHYLTDAQQAFTEAERALKLAQDQGSPSVRVQAHYIVALAFAALGKPAPGLEYAQAAVAQARAMNDQVLEGWSLLQLGYIYKQLADWESAQAVFGESLTVNRARGNPFALSRTLLHLGDVCQELGAAAQAWQHYREALALAQEIGFVWAEQDALKRLANQSKS